jgi:phenylacetate-CoA ligase
MQGWADFARRYQPVLLQGYASVLADFARFVIATSQRMPASFRGVFSTAEVLSDTQRHLMEQAFGCKVHNQYGSREIPNIACECRHGRMHVFTDMVYLESLGAAAREDAGQLVVTSLTNRLMPFIRYAIGDTGQLLDDACDCGSPFPLMAMGMCRHNDHIRTRHGKRFHPAYFSKLLAPLPQIRHYQFIQTAIDRLILNVVVSEPLAAEQFASIRTRIASDLDAAMAFEINPVDEIRRTASGKHRYVISQGGPYES